MSSPVSPRPSSHRCFVSSLPLWRSWSRRAWWLHLWLIASLLLPPLSLTQAGVGSYTQNDPISGTPVEYHYEDINDNGVWDSGEPSWPESEFGDNDSDGLEDGRETYWGTSPYVPDSDYDGISDGDEVNLLGGPANGYSPTHWDTNSDGYSDHDHFYNCFTVNYNTLGTGSSYYDWDGDGTTNPNDLWPTDYYNGGSPPESDSDGDGVYDSSDSHPSNNSLWNDWNNNGTNDDQEGGGGSDPTTTDSDGDGHYDAYDSHPSDSSLKSDWNYNGYNDEVDPYLDSDSDSYPNSSDSHPSDSNLWCDWNGNGINDHLEYDPYTTDSDGDGRYDAYDSHINDSYLWNDWNYNGTNDDNEAFDDDGDGYYNANDSHPQNPALWDDWDDDGLTGDAEATFGSNPNVKDTDGDGLHDGQEHALGTSPTQKDTDSDGLTDYEETQLTPASSPISAHSLSPVYTDWYMRDMTDLDEDGIPGIIERLYGLSDDNAADALGDLNSNQLTNKQDYDAGNALKTKVTFLDWDGDGLTNIMEYHWGTKVPGILSPWLPHDAVQDADGDGLLNFEELALDLHPGDADSSTPELDVGNQWASPGVLAPHSADLVKARLSHPTWTWPVVPAKAADGSSPAVAGDVDGDGMPDAWEHRHRPLSGNDLSVRSPIDAGQDIDEDGLTNLTEFRYQTDPRVQKTNGENEDGVSFHGQGTPTSGQPTGLLNRYRADIAQDMEVGEPINKSYTQGSGGVAGGITNEPDYQPPYVKFTVRTEESHPYKPASERFEIDAATVRNKSLPTLCGGETDKCTNCDGSNSVKVPCDTCSSGRKTCLAGPCVFCNNKGYFECSDCDGTGKKTVACWVCHGLKPDPDDCACGDVLCNCHEACNIRRREVYVSRAELVTDPFDPNQINVEFDIYLDGVKQFTLASGDAIDRISETALRAGAGKIGLVEAREKPEPPSYAGSCSVGDQGGPQYRKVGLNGIPIPDAKPQMQDESGEREEETYIDAYNQQLRHSVSDVYVKAEGSLLPLTVRRDFAPEGWTIPYQENAVFSPIQQMARPFGLGWSSNICSYISLDSVDNTSNVSLKATVVDEQGSEQTFVRFHGAWTHSKEQKVDFRTAFNSLSTGSGQAILRKKFGTVCTYEIVSSIHFAHLPHPRSSDTVRSTFGRLKKVVDRYGNELRYTYADELPGSTAQKSLIPCKIEDPDRPGHMIQITQDNGHVTQVSGPGGDIITYRYGTPENPSLFLTEVERGSNSIVKYDYSSVSELDPTPTDPADVTTYGHLELSSITDELNRSYDFDWSFDHSKMGRAVNTDNQIIDIVLAGQPRLLTQVSSPGNNVVHIDGDRDRSSFGSAAALVSMVVDQNNRIQAQAMNSFQTKFYRGAANARTHEYVYTFSQPTVFKPPMDGPDESPLQTTFLVTYHTMVIENPAGQTETYAFNERAGMAVSSVTDSSGNVTKFYYSPLEIQQAVQLDPASPLAAIDLQTLQTNRIGGLYFDDPLVELNALGGIKRFAYHELTRVLSQSIDARGMKTDYAIDDMGRMTSETVRHPTNGVVRSVNYTYDITFPGMIAKKVLNSSDTATASSITRYSLASDEITDPNYTPGWWREVTVSVGGMQWIDGQSQFVPLTTTTTISDFNGNKRSVIDGRGYVTNFGYDGNNRLTSVSFPKKDAAAANVTKTLEYDLHGNLTKEVNELGVATFYEYDVLNRRIKTTVDLNGNNAPNGRYTSLTTNAGTGVPTYNGDLVTETSYNVFNLPEYETDARGIRTRHDYDSAGRRIQTTVNDQDLDPTKQQVTKFSNGNTDETDDFVGGSVFDTSGFKPLQVTDPRGTVTQFTYDGLYRETSRIMDVGSAPAHQNATIQSAHDAVGNVIQVIDPLGRTTVNEYDALNQVVKTTFKESASHQTGHVVQTFYNAYGKPWKVINELNHTTLTHYDAVGRAVKVVAPFINGVSVETHTRYDAAGNAVEVEDALGRITLTQYDECNRPVKVIAPPVWDAVGGNFVRPTTTTTYDALGQTLTVTDAVGGVTEKWYDRAGRTYKMQVKNSATGSGPATLHEYDAAGNAVKVTDARRYVTLNTYDPFNRLLTTRDGANIVNTFTYDQAGNRLTVKDGLNRTTTFTYDRLNRQLSQVFPNGDAWSYAYNGVNKTSQTDPKQVTTYYTYDHRHRLKTVAPGTDPMRTYDYDDAGQLRMVSEAGQPAADVEYDYDALGRVTVEVSRGQLHRYTYDKVGNRTKAIYESKVVSGVEKGRTVVTSYDALNRPETIAEGGRLTQYGYDRAGRAVILVLGNGQVTENVYDGLGRLVNRTLFQSLGQRAASGVVAEFGWSHDTLGNVTAQHETWQGAVAAGMAGRSATVRTTAMTYDAANRLKTEVVSDPVTGNTSTTNFYDAGNNITFKMVTGGAEPGYWTYTYNTANQLVEWKKNSASGGTELKSASLTYDLNGNRTSQVIGGTADSGGVNPPNKANGTTSYTWDNTNRLASVTLPDGKQFSYTYDYRMRRVATQASGTGVTPKHTSIVFSGGLSVSEYESASAPGSGGVPAATAPVVQYQRGPDMGGGIGGMLYSLRDASGTLTPKYSLNNGRGDIVAQSDQAATLTWTASYEAHGRRTVETGVNEDKQRANSKDEDPTGLLNEGFRYRDLETGVWLSRDPAGFVDGPNLYAYVKQNPWTSFDPKGLYSWREFGEDYSNFVGQAFVGWGQANGFIEQSAVSGDNPSKFGRVFGQSIGFAQGVVEMQLGAATLGAGLGGELTSVGVASPVAIPVALAGAAGMVHGGYVTYNALDAMMNQEVTSPAPKNSTGGSSAKETVEQNAKVDTNPKEGVKKETGSYTNTHESGMTYDGKGSRKRSQDSAQRVEQETGDKHIATDWTPAETQREAFKQESRRLDSHGGANSAQNHNKIESPGKKMRESDGDD